MTKVVEMTDNKTLIIAIHKWIDEAWDLGMNAFDTFQDLSEKAYRESEKIGYDKGMGLAKRNLAYKSLWNSEERLAYGQIKESIRLLNDIGSDKELGTVYDILGYIFMNWGSYDNALDSFYKSINFFKKADFKRGLAWAYSAIANVYQIKKDYESSKTFSNDAIQIFKEINFPTGINITSIRLGLVFRDSGEYQRAIEHYERLLMEYEQSMMPIERFEISLNLSSVHRMLGAYDQAYHCINEAETILKTNSEFASIGKLNLEKGKILRGLNKLDEAKIALLYACEYSQEKNYKPLQAEAENELAMLFETQGDFEKAYSHYKHYMHLKEEIDSEERNTNFRKIQVRQEIQLVEKEAEINRLKNVELKKANLDVNRLLNNANQGFLTLTSKLEIEPHYSFVCNDILGDIEVGKSIIELIQFCEEDDCTNVDILTKIASQLDGLDHNIVQLETMLELLPDTLTIGDKAIQIEYKIIEDMNQDKLMLILTDITAKKRLEKQVQHEEDILKMLVEILTNANEFNRLLREYRFFYTEELPDYKQLSKEAIYNEMKRIYRVVHTFKGMFSTFYMKDTVDKLNSLEDILNEFVDEDDQSIKDMIAFMDFLDWEGCIQYDVELIRENVTDVFFSSDESFKISGEQIKNLLLRLNGITQLDQLKDVMESVNEVRLIDINDLLKHYPDKILAMSERYGKMIKPFCIEGPTIRVLADPYKKWIDTLVHVFRNAIDHGIEADIFRDEQFKPLEGEIKVSVKEVGSDFEVSISDDGGGIDLEALKSKVVDLEIYSASEFDALDLESKLNVVFIDKFTTQNEVTALSGRGVGLASVKEEVERIGGSVKIDTEKGKGTQFRFTLPIIVSDV